MCAHNFRDVCTLYSVQYSSFEAHLAAVARQLGCESRQPGNKKCFNNKFHLYFEAVGPHCLKKICKAGELFFMDGTRFLFPGKGFEITVLISRRGLSSATTSFVTTN